jgi:hypothetical protein
MTRQLILDRIAQSINVSGAFDNCFFHCFAAHILAHELPLPQDLFTFNSIIGDSSPATRLQALITQPQDLDLFTEFDRFKYPDNPDNSNHIVEKTLVLGVLFREWFATEMLSDPTQMNEMLLGIQTSFKTYKTFRKDMDKQLLMTGPEATKYLANEEFLEYFSARKEGRLTIKELKMLSPLRRKFEQYFINAKWNEDLALASYWRKEGFAKYCRFLAQPKVKLSPEDFLPILKILGQSLTIYGNDGSELLPPQIESNIFPNLEISLDIAGGHYHLLTSVETADYLSEYENSLAVYLHERTLILEESSLLAKRMRAEQSKYPLVAAICSEHLQKDPLELMIDKIRRMKEFVGEAVQQEQMRIEQEQLRLREQERRERELRRIQQFSIEKIKIQHEFKNSLNLLKKHISPEATLVYARLHTAQRELFSQLAPDANKNTVRLALKRFLRECEKNVNEADALMGYGWTYRITEILVKGILGFFAGAAMILGAMAGQGVLNEKHRRKYKDTFFTLDKSTGCLALETFNQQLSALKGKISQLEGSEDNNSLNLS